MEPLVAFPRSMQSPVDVPKVPHGAAGLPLIRSSRLLTCEPSRVALFPIAHPAALAQVI